MLRKRVVLFFLFIVSINTSFGQKVDGQKLDGQKVKRIGEIICNCLDRNIGQPDLERINECSIVLAEGLSVIKSDSLRHLYLNKSDTYLQKNCRAYIEILSAKTSDSNVKLESQSTFIDLKNNNGTFDLGRFNNKTFLYRDFVGDTIYLSIKDGTLTEKNRTYNTVTTFSIRTDELGTVIIFVDSDEEFFRDYYSEGEEIDFIMTEQEDGRRLYMNFSNGIVLSKRLESVDDENGLVPQ